jgi:MerC mercury resistance protein
MDEKVFATAPRSWIDSLGATASIACAIQCSVFPLLVGILPLLGLGFFLGDGVEKFFLATSVVVAVSSFTWGFRYHRRFYVFLFFVSAAALIIAGRLWVDERYEVPFVVSGSLILSAGHFLNRRLCRLCAECGENRQLSEHASAHVKNTGRKEKRS